MRKRWGPRCGASLIALAALVLSPIELGAQETGDFPARDGRIVITGFSGTAAPGDGASPPEGRTALDETVIDTQGGSLKIFDIADGDGAPDGGIIGGEPVLSVPAGEIGQVFGLARDDAEVPNIYAAATSAFGLQIVAPGGDGQPARIKTGAPDARFMGGQFGAGGGPGSIWRIDGRTGRPSLFATIAGPEGPNSGPGLGNLTFDADHQQLYVSDLDTGLIHRVDLSGRDLGSFDHGVDGRTADGLSPVPDDPAARADITAASFDAENPDTWGFTAPERRVWGLAYHGGRLYYAVWEGPEIWSVGIAADGGFADDARREVTVPGDPIAYPVSDIAFDGDGTMVLAQRGEIRARYDYTVFALPRRSRALRYLPSDDGGWGAEPAVYAIGFPATHQNAAGGVSLGYGYDEDGRIDTESCFATLWATGDALRQSAAERDRLARGGPSTVHGAQAAPSSLLEPQNVPPWTSYFLDYDGRFEDPNAAGLVGDIEAVTRCPQAPTTAVAQAPEPRERPEEQETSEAEETPQPPLPEPEHETPQPSPEAPPREAGEETPALFDLAVTIETGGAECRPGESCALTITVANEGTGAFRGSLAILDEPQPPDARIAGWSPEPWSCAAMRESLVCIHPDTTLAAGESRVLNLELTPRSAGPSGAVDNCARFLWNGATLRPRTALVQEALNARGLDAGPVDGALGPQTRSAIEAFRATAGLAAGSEIDGTLMAALFGDWGQGDLTADNDAACLGGAPAPSSPSSSESEATEAPPPPPGAGATSPAECVGGQVWSEPRRQCVCPPNKPVWNAAEKACRS